MKSNTRAKGLTTVLTGLFLIGIVCHATADGKCSEKTLRGGYGYTVTGNLLEGPFAGPFVAVGRLDFDGRGNFKNIRTINRNGDVLLDAPGEGTYTVTEDCRGTFTFTDGGVVTLGTDIVIDDKGDEIRMVTTTPGVVLSVIGRKI